MTDVRSGRAAGWAAGAMVMMAVAQAGVLVLTGTSADRARGVALAVAAGVLGVARWPVRGRLAALALVSLLGAGHFVAHVQHLPDGFPWRLAQVAVLAGYGALAVAALVAACRVPLREALLLGAVLGVTALGLEAGLPPLQAALDARAAADEGSVGQPPGVATMPPGAETRWVGGPVPHPQLGEFYAPFSHARSIYPSNPRGYFAPETATWNLEVHADGTHAALEFPAGAPGHMRVAISSARELSGYAVVLSERNLPLAGGAYTLTFQARTDAPRTIWMDIGQAHAPWTALGFGVEREVDTGWRTFTEPMTLTADANAQLRFQLGASAASVELRDVVLRRDGDGAIVTPQPPYPEFAVRYDFNSRGCRGPEYPAPKPSGRGRVLAIGDSYTLGVGVHEPDTFSAQLERRLRRRFAGAWDVVNCGVSGYATREARLHYELYGASYQPDVVLLSVLFNDDVSWLDEQRLGYVRQPGRYEALSALWRLVQTVRYRRRYDYTASMKELRALVASVERRGARLAVAVFSDEGSALGQAVTGALHGTSVPVLWLDVETPEQQVHPLDGHPNEVVHGVVAERLEAFLVAHGLVGPR